MKKSDGNISEKSIEKFQTPLTDTSVSDSLQAYRQYLLKVLAGIYFQGSFAEISDLLLEELDYYGVTNQQP